jgi:hypothetical protein
VKQVVFADISNPNTSKSKIIDLIIPVDEWPEIALTAHQNAENEHCGTLQKQVHKLNFHHLTCLYRTLKVVFVYFYSSNLNLQCERVGISRLFESQYKYIQNHWLKKTRWRMSRNRIFSSPKCRKWRMWNTQETNT